MRTSRFALLISGVHTEAVEAERMQGRGSVIILLGPPGAGKGTQAERLSSSLGIPSISTGEILRQACRSGSALGAEVQTLLEAGQLVQDELVQEVLVDRLRQADCGRGYILDGFPRTAAQARFLDKFLAGGAFSAPVVFDLAIAAQVLIDRLGSRRQCPECARTYHVTPEASRTCANDGAELMIRNDDQPETIRRRLEVYADHTSEIIHFYQKRGYQRVDASEPVEKVTQRLLSGLGAAGSKNARDFVRQGLAARPSFA